MTTSIHDWLHLSTFLDLCRDDEQVQAELANEKVSRSRMNKLLDAIFEDQYLVWLLEQWTPEIREELGKQLVLTSRRNAAEPPVARPKSKTPRRRKKCDIDPAKKYRWICRDCGERSGVHYYPVTVCRSCGATILVEREETLNLLGYPGSKLLARTTEQE